jgi:hypothetical protein
MEWQPGRSWHHLQSKSWGLTFRLYSIDSLSIFSASFTFQSLDFKYLTILFI